MRNFIPLLAMVVVTLPVLPAHAASLGAMSGERAEISLPRDYAITKDKSAAERRLHIIERKARAACRSNEARTVAQHQSATRCEALLVAKAVKQLDNKRIYTAYSARQTALG